MSIMKNIRMRQKRNLANLFKVFDFEDIDRIYMILCIFAFIRIIWALVKGLTMELAGEEFIQKFIISGNDVLLTIPEIIQIVLLLYIVFIAFVHDLIYEPRPSQLPLVLILMFLLFLSIGFFEKVGNNLIFAILAVLFVIVMFGPINAVITEVGLEVAHLLIVPGLGATIVSLVLSIILPIMAVVVIVVSFFQYLSF